ncbi:serine hydrolase [Ramlibacter sp. AN1133]|uniref:serine hydrolase n=1 Tax=Ramlibacter sp. AN1133 TaxID=3133429 RepID=UPI004040806C
MPSPSKNKDLRLAVLVAALVAAGGLLPLAYHYGREHRPAAPATQVAGGPATPAPAPEAEAAPPAPPGAEVVPPEEAETDRGPAAASPAGPTLSFGRAAGLHLKPDPLHLSSSAAFVMDQDTGQVLAQKNETVVLPMASLTKLMTTLLVLEAKQPMDEVLTITEDDVDTERHSRSRLRVGTQLTREEALRLALMSSENRAAHALGRSYPGGLPKLVEAMNARARALGMANTTYVDPTGLSNRNQSTAQDLARLVAEAAKNPVMREFSTTPTHLASLSGRTLQYRNSNRLVRNQNGGWDIELQKTGYIVEAGRCLTMLAKVGGHNLIMVMLDADSNGTRLADAQRLRKWVVARNGWQDQPVMARAAPEPARERVAAKDKAEKAVSLAAVKARKGEKASAGKDGKRTQVASAKKRRAGAKTAVAKADAGDRKTAVAKKDDRKARVAKKDDGQKAGRVSRTFAARADHKG